MAMHATTPCAFFFTKHTKNGPELALSDIFIPWVQVFDLWVVLELLAMLTWTASGRLKKWTGCLALDFAFAGALCVHHNATDHVPLNPPSNYFS